MDKIGALFFLEAGDEGRGGRHSDGVAAAAVADGGHHAAAAGIAAVVATMAHCCVEFNKRNFQFPKQVRSVARPGQHFFELISCF